MHYCIHITSSVVNIVKVDNIADIAAAGADTFVAGSAIFNAHQASDPHGYDSVIQQMRAALAKVR